MKDYLVIAYYTSNSGYAEESKKLVETLKQFDLNYHLREIESLGSWGANTNFKPFFIRKCLEFFGYPVLYVDVDALFRAKPNLIETLNCDFACHIKDGYELLSGTLYFEPTDKSFQLIDDWIRRIENEPMIWEQIHLHNALRFFPNNHNGQEVKFVELPAAYCQIFDLMKDEGAPVIEHFQASRRFKDVIV